MGRRTSNALIPIVGGKAVNAEDHTQSVVKKNLRIGEAKQNTHREREREAQRISYIFIHQECNSYK